ncbi:hypothetical protein [Streptomyces uncialis]|uniref:hypothetical protein n=1 Tax=Streptomyces uncialis TaxID=1048205 RepID=UPI0033EEF720
MQSVLVVLLVLAWAAIAFLTFGYAALVGKVRALETRGSTSSDPSRRWPDLAAPAAAKRTLALVVSSTCPTCEEAVAAWPAIRRALSGAGHRTLLIDIDNSGRWKDADAGEIRQGAELSSPLLLAYQPALLLLDADGALLSAEPVGSAETLTALTAEHLTSAPVTAPTTGVAS